MTAPERIWAKVNGMSTRLPDGGRQLVGGWSQDPTRSGVTEYVRADLYAALEAQLAEARKALAALDRMSRGVDWCDQDEQARRWSAARLALTGGRDAQA